MGTKINSPQKRKTVIMETIFDFECFVLELNKVCRSDAQKLINMAYGIRD